jgi:Mlc titration factor MtfA (ptsG expression regulator)
MENLIIKNCVVILYKRISQSDFFNTYNVVIAEMAIQPDMRDARL